MIADFRLCIQQCSGKSCCNCCSKAPNLHRVSPYDSGISFRLVYSRECCYNSRRNKPQECMYLQGKTRRQWQKEQLEQTDGGDSGERKGKGSG